MTEGLDVEHAYTERIPILNAVAIELETKLKEAFREQPRVDSIRSRVKTVTSFVEKACKQEGGQPKYRKPLDEIQDQIGCRIVVFFRSDLIRVEELVLEEFHRIEADHKLPTRPSIFEYEATHFTCHIPHDIAIRHSCPVNFFELQIKTLFQHACAQAYHDVGYKSRTTIDFNDDRLMHFAFASAWGADEIFDQMWKKHQGSMN